MPESLALCLITIQEALRFIRERHRHHPPPKSGLFAIAAQHQEKIVAVALVGRPVSRALDMGYTAEVTRLCTKEGNPNAASMLYGAC